MATQTRYQMIADRLVAEVAQGKYPVGGTLPTEPELCSRFGVARNTVREALRVLHDMGLVAAQRGVGTIVRAKTSAPRYVHAVESLSSLFDYLQETALEILQVHEFAATGELCGFLRCKEGMRWIDVSATRTAGPGKSTISFSNLYVPEIYGDIVPRMNGLAQPTYSLLEEMHGLTVAEVDQHATVAAMPAIAARPLAVRKGSPAQVVDRHYTGPAGEVLLASRSFYPPGTFTLGIKLRLIGGPSKQRERH